MSDSSSAYILTPELTTFHPEDWERIRQNRDLIEVAKFRANCASDELRPEVDALYEDLRKETLAAMHHNPSRFNKQAVDDLIGNRVFSFEDFTQQGLITPESWQKLQIRRDYLPDMNEYLKDARDLLPTSSAVTDVYFFGMPTCGKTSLLTGIAAANGQGFTLDMRTNGGPYAAALRQYAQAGISPGRTNGKFVTTISGVINYETPRGRIKSYPVNLVEMSGEEFALRIAETKEPSIANMGTGVTNLLRNDHRKVFFIVVDASKEMVKVSYLDHEIDEEEEIVRRVKSRYISQLDILDKFISLISLPDNQEIMNTVSAIHFIVTKADSICKDGNLAECDERATNLIYTKYLSVVESLKTFCRRTHRINRATDYEPQVVTFSLGHFYLGSVFDYDSTDTLKIIDAIRESSATRNLTFWQRIRAFLSL